MTRKEFIKEGIKSIFSIAITVIAAMILLSLTTVFQEKEKTKEQLIRLDKEKASIEYVDMKCDETKKDIKEDLTEIKEQQKITNQDIKELLKRR